MFGNRFGVGALALVGLAATAIFPACGGGDDETAAGGPTVVKGAGDIGPKVDQFRNLLGPDNGGAPNGDANGRREINWDKVPDQLAAPNALPADFFNATKDPGARGAVLETPGDHVAVSADSDNPTGAAVRFGDINPSYSDEFTTFSAQRLFSPDRKSVV